MSELAFDRQLAEECARAYTVSTGLGCTVADKSGGVVFECGYGCESCGLCLAAGIPHEKCAGSQSYGMEEALRFGGKYVYFCPMGLTLFVSPIVGDAGGEAKITVGPFIMVEPQDFIDCELKDNAHLEGDALKKAIAALERVPYIAPARVNELSNLLFYAVGFMNSVSATSNMRSNERSDEIQRHISAYIMELKETCARPAYPFDKERALLARIDHGDKAGAQKLLNELLGAILFEGGGDMDRAKARVYELMVLVSRAAVERGADGEQSLQRMQMNFETIRTFQNIEDLCFWLTKVVNGFMNNLFEYTDAKHANLIHRCISYMSAHCGEEITLTDMARRLYISPAYLSRIFKRETGTAFSAYMNALRVHKAKELLTETDTRLTDIAQLVGFQDQSYFTKVFKRVSGCVPSEYRLRHISGSEQARDEE